MARISITPTTKVGELLDTCPELEEVLIGMSPAFEKLRNPILRRTVAKVATLQQIAGIGNLRVDEVVNGLRKAVGCNTQEITDESQGFVRTDHAGWFSDEKILKRFNATEMIVNGNNPMSHVMKLATELDRNQILELTTPFLPSPLLNLLTEKGLEVYAMEMPDGFRSYIRKV